MKTTTISIHTPLTEKVLEGLEDLGQRVFHVVHSTGISHSYHIETIYKIFKEQPGYIAYVLIERSFTEDEVEKMAVYFSKYSNEVCSSTQSELYRGFIKGFMAALSIPKEKEGEK